ncbi:hypothetical protein Prudu_008902, partial [Prunus dulcis]
MQRFVSQNRCFDCTYSADKTLSWSGNMGIFRGLCQNFGRESRFLESGPNIGKMSEQRRDSPRFQENSG